MKFHLFVCIVTFGLVNVSFGQVTIDGNQTVTGNLTVNGDLTVKGDLIVNGRIITDGSEPPIPEPGEEEADIFVELWRLDQQHNGMSVTLRGADGRWEDEDADLGLDEQGMSLNPGTDSAPSPMIVVIDESKLSAATYQRVKALFDNYQAQDGQAEDQLGTHSEEDAEIDSLMDAVMATSVISRCLQHISESNLRPGGGDYTADEFRTLMVHQWFELYTNHFSSPKPNCSGFEHVFMGDHNRSKIGGHHFWFKFLEDHNAGNADSLGHKYKGPPGEHYPWLATFRMRWSPERGLTMRDPEQKGFFVGCSPELMLAYGTLGLLVEKQTGRHPIVSLDGGKFELTIHASTLPGGGDPDDRRGNQIRSAFPKLMTFAGPDSPGSGVNVTVAQGLAASIGQHLQVEGIIIAEHNEQFGLQLADSETGGAPFLAVKLPKTFRETFNAKLNPAAKGKRAVVHGRRDLYTGIPGIKDVTHVEFLD